jgi:hypothetical protein
MHQFRPKPATASLQAITCHAGMAYLICASLTILENQFLCHRKLPKTAE